MAPIIPAGGRMMEWVPNQGNDIKKQAQGMFEDDPQLQAIKGLPGMQDGIDELESMSTDCGAPPCEGGEGMVSDVASTVPIDVAPMGETTGGGAVEKAIEKVKDAAQGVADAAVKDVEKAVTDAVKGAGKPKIDEIKPETPAEEKGEEHEKSETPAEEKKEEKGEKKDEKKDGPEIPGVEGEKDGKVEKDGDEEDKKEDKPAFAASVPRLRRIAELAPGEVKDLRHYWGDLLGFPKEYVDAMLKNYKA